MAINNFKFIFVSKQTLLYIASVVWAFAGVMLICRGANVLIEYPSCCGSNFIIGILGGLLFYFLMFSKISSKHILRIKNIASHEVTFYSFFNRRSYIMMFSMISLGILLRLSGLIPILYLAVFYICMGLPLFISSQRFLFHAINFQKNGKLKL
jgi:hypothetical protein